MLNFKQFQRDTLLRMLRLQPQSQSSLSSLSAQQQSFKPAFDSQSLQWKVLVYDKYGRDVIAPQLTLQQLKQEGVTLHLLLNQPREVIKQVPIIYFLRPTESNITFLLNDFNRQLYDTIYINFTTIPPGFLERLASRLANECIYADTLSNHIKEINNIMIDYICTEDNCISLNHNFSYLCIYSSLLSQEHIFKYIKKIGSSLLSLIFQVYTNHNTLPYFYIPQSSATPSHMVIKYVCEHLPTLISNYYFQQNGGLQSATSLQNSLSQIHYSKRWKLVLLDRNMTLGSQFLQNIQYLSLVYDLGFKHGHVTVPQSDASSTSTQVQLQQQGQNIQQDLKNNTFQFQNIDIDSNDSLWIHNRYKILPDVAETVHNTNIQYKNEIARINGLMQGGMNATQQPNQLQGLGTTDYNSIITTLPMLTRKKTQLDAHTSICTTLVQTTGQRQLHKTFPLELSLLSTHFKNLFKPGVGITGNGIDGISINPSTQQPVCFDDLIKMLQMADQLANKNRSNPMSPQQVQQSSNQYTGSLSPRDRLRLLCLMILSGFTTTSTNATFINLVTNLKSSANDSRYFPHFHINSTQIDQIISFCISTFSNISLQFKSQATSTSQSFNLQNQQQTTGGNNSNTSSLIGTKALSLFAGSASLFSSQETHTPIRTFAIDPSPYTAVHSGSNGAQNLDKSAPLLLIDPIISILAASSNSTGGQKSIQPVQLPSHTELIGLETMIFMVGSGNYTEYINLCGEYSNFIYYNDHTSQQTSSSSSLTNTNIGSSSMPGSVNFHVVGYDDDLSHKTAYTERIQKGLLPKGVVYGCTEMMSNFDFFNMISIIALLNFIVTSNSSLSQSLSTKVQGILALVQNGIIPTNVTNSNFSQQQPAPAQQLANLQQQFIQQLTTLSQQPSQQSSQQPSQQHGISNETESAITQQIAQAILSALEVSQQ